MFVINIEGDVKDNTINNINGSVYKTVEKKTSLLEELYQVLITVQTRKHRLESEEEANEKLVDLLRSRNILASDETRQGRSGSEKETDFKSGELDIGIRGVDNTGNVVSIVEAFELSSCGSKNKTIGDHIGKLIERYDTAGNPENFVIVYSKAKDFKQLWEKYKKHIAQEVFQHEIDFKVLNDHRFNKSEIKVGYHSYTRSGESRGLYHLFVNMFTGN